MKKLFTTGEVEISEKAYKVLLITGTLAIVVILAIAMMTGDLYKLNSLYF